MNERRVRRSDDPVTALHHQLAWAQKAAKLDAMVLVDETGSIVAGSGAFPVCEELAAYAPLLATRDSFEPSVDRALAELRGRVSMRQMVLHGSEVFLVAKGEQGPAADASLVRAAAGCRRILGAEL